MTRNPRAKLDVREPADTFRAIERYHGDVIIHGAKTAMVLTHHGAEQLHQELEEFLYGDG